MRFQQPFRPGDRFPTSRELRRLMRDSGSGLHIHSGSLAVGMDNGRIVLKQRNLVLPDGVPEVSTTKVRPARFGYYTKSEGYLYYYTAGWNAGVTWAPGSGFSYPTPAPATEDDVYSGISTPATFPSDEQDQFVAYLTYSQTEDLYTYSFPFSVQADQHIYIEESACASARRMYRLYNEDQYTKLENYIVIPVIGSEFDEFFPVADFNHILDFAITGHNESDVTINRSRTAFLGGACSSATDSITEYSRLEVDLNVYTEEYPESFVYPDDVNRAWAYGSSDLVMGCTTKTSDSVSIVLNDYANYEANKRLFLIVRSDFSFPSQPFPLETDFSDWYDYQVLKYVSGSSYSGSYAEYGGILTSYGNLSAVYKLHVPVLRAVPK